MSKPTLQIGNGNWGVRDGGLLGYVEGDTIDKFAPVFLDSTRGTNISATRVGKDGLIEKGRENLIKDSNNLERWVHFTNYSVSGGVEGYDGKSNAYKISKNVTGNSYFYTNHNVTVSAGVWTYSLYAKAGSLGAVFLYTGSGNTGTGSAVFDLANGKVHDVTTSTTEFATMEDVGGGWYRCSITSVNDPSGYTVRFKPTRAEAGGQFSSHNDSDGYIFVQYPQLEAGTAPSAVIETGSPRNLFTNSNALNDSDWAKNSITLEGNQLGYDGSHNAWKMTKTADNYKQISQAIEGSNVVRTISVYAKAGSLNHVSLFHRDNDADPLTDSGKKFDLVNGVVEAAGSAGNAISASMKDVGDGWYRCQMTYNHTGGDVVRIYAEFEETAAGYIYIQNPQLENGDAATEYSGTSNYAGLREDTPRIDYTDSEGYLVMEPQRTNGIKYSEYIGHTNWVNGGATRNIDITYMPNEVAPDGSKGCYKIKALTTNNQLSYIATITAEETYTNSFYIKRVSGTTDIKFYDINNVSTDFSLSESDGWKRVVATATGTADTGTTGRHYINFGTTSGIVGDEILVWGAQQEEGDFVTSYIPTHGSSVTREQDVITFDKDIAYEGWTVYMEVDNMTINGIDTNVGNFFFRGQANENVSALFFFGTCFGYRATDGTNKYVCGKLGNTGDVFSGKWAVTYDGVNTIKIYVDGSQDGSVNDVDPNFSKGIQSGSLQYQGSNSRPTKNIKDLRVYDKELTQAEAEALTS